MTTAEAGWMVTATVLALLHTIGFLWRHRAKRQWEESRNAGIQWANLYISQSPCSGSDFRHTRAYLLLRHLRSPAYQAERGPGFAEGVSMVAHQTIADYVAHLQQNPIVDNPPQLPPFDDSPIIEIDEEPARRLLVRRAR